MSSRAIAGASLVAVLGATAPRAHAIIWNGPNHPERGVTSVNGLLDMPGPWANVHNIVNSTNNTRGTATYLGNGWVITARHVVQNGGDYNTLAPAAQISFFGFTGTQVVAAAGGAEIALVKLNGTPNLPGVSQHLTNGGFSETNRIGAMGGYGLWGQIEGTTSNGVTFHRGYNVVNASGGFVNATLNSQPRLQTLGLLQTGGMSGDSGSPLFILTGADSAVSDWAQYSLAGVLATSQGNYWGSNSSYSRASSFTLFITSTVYTGKTFQWARGISGTFSWNNSTLNGDVTNGNNWNNANSPNFPLAAGDIANLGNASIGNNVQTINLDQNLTIGALTIGNTSGLSGTQTLGAGGGFSMTFDNTGTAAAIVHNVTGQADVISAPIVIAGQGSLNLTNASVNPFTLSGTIKSGLSTGAQTLVHTSGNTTISGAITDGALGGKMGVTVTGGVLTLSGANNYNHATHVTNGTLIFSGTTNNVSAVDSVGSAAGANGVLVIPTGATFGANGGADQFISGIVIGGNSTGAGTVKLSPGGTMNVARQMALGSGTGGYAAYSQTGGTATVGSFLAVGFNNDRSVLNVGGGSLTVGTNLITIAAGGTGAIGVANISGGTVTSTATTGYAPTIGGIFVGENGSGTLNVSGTALMTLSGWGLRVAPNAGATGTVNLLGGTVTTTSVSKGAGSGIVNFNGGTLKAKAASANFISGLNSAYVHSGGATIDDGGFAVTIAQPLIAPTGNGVSSAGLTFAGGGFIDTPIVQITGNGTGASAIANVDAGGNLTGITITNPGIGYTSPPTFALLGGGNGNTGAIGGSATLVPNTGGGLTKQGAGTLTLTGLNTYSGATNVLAGKLVTTNAIKNGAALSLSGNAVLEIPVNGAAGGVTSVGAITIPANGANYAGKIELNDNDLVVNYGAGTSTYAGILAMIRSGLPLLGTAGADGTGITSVRVQNQTLSGTMLGVVDGALIGGAVTSLSGFTVPAPTTSVLVKYTWRGDANLDGIVNGSDYALADTGFSGGGAGWFYGDVNYDGSVNGSDYALIDTGFSSQPGPVPEPGMMGLLGISALTLLRRRKRA
ncbi:MAG: autotransporter-associated beta strand repeat-containing protein [Burkholderiales bacterium]|nr:autotransporter-associated beta strand repeat-containing protein [Phycisphaerae bacterium]